MTAPNTSLTFTVTTKDKTERNAFVTEVQSWKVNKNLAYPNIKDVVAQGKKVLITFHKSDSFKVVRMVRRLGLDIDVEAPRV